MNSSGRKAGFIRPSARMNSRLWLNRDLPQRLRIPDHRLLPPRGRAIQTRRRVRFQPVQNGSLSAALVERDEELVAVHAAERVARLAEFRVERFEHAVGD